jgi:hypothetical protein
MEAEIHAGGNGECLEMGTENLEVKILGSLMTALPE